MTPRSPDGDEADIDRAGLEGATGPVVTRRSANRLEHVMARRRVRWAAGALSIGLALSPGCGAVPQGPARSDVPSPSPIPVPSDLWPAQGQGVPRAILSTWGFIESCGIDSESGNLAPCASLPFRFASPSDTLSSVAAAPTGGWAFVLGPDGLQSFRVDGAGGLERLDGLPEQCPTEGFPDPHLFVHPTRRLVYVRCQTYARVDPAGFQWNVSKTFDAFRVDLEGRLGAAPSASFSMPGPSATSFLDRLEARAGVDLAIHPQREWAYVGDPPFVQRYQILETGALVPLERTPASFGENSSALALDPRGDFLFTSGFQVFKIDPQTGALTSVASLPYAAEQVQTEPSGRWVFRVRLDESAGRVIETYALSRGSGALTLVASLPAPPYHHGNYTRVAAEPSGRFLYFVSTVGIDEDVVVSIYRIESDGRLTPSSGYHWGDYPVELALFRRPGS
jgi:hypothetical protein